MELDSSLSSGRTVIDCQDAQDQDQGLDGGHTGPAGRSHGGYREEVRTSSSRSSEIVKVESLPLSEVTSCDELEGGVDVDNCTNNSSDLQPWA